MYAITNTSYRVVSSSEILAVGESLVSELPVNLLSKIKGEEMKVERSRLLRTTDWTQSGDSPLTALEKTAYAVYRQALRDLPSLPGFPDVLWPIVPVIREGAASSGPLETIGD